MTKRKTLKNKGSRSSDEGSKRLRLEDGTDTEKQVGNMDSEKIDSSQPGTFNQAADPDGHQGAPENNPECSIPETGNQAANIDGHDEDPVADNQPEERIPATFNQPVESEGHVGASVPAKHPEYSVPETGNQTAVPEIHEEAFATDNHPEAQAKAVSEHEMSEQCNLVGHSCVDNVKKEKSEPSEPSETKVKSVIEEKIESFGMINDSLKQSNVIEDRVEDNIMRTPVQLSEKPNQANMSTMTVIEVKDIPKATDVVTSENKGKGENYTSAGLDRQGHGMVISPGPAGDHGCIATIENAPSACEQSTPGTEDITDSQLCAMDWSSQFPTETTVNKATGVQEPGVSQVSSMWQEPWVEDGTAVVVTLIKELQQFNKSLLKTKREMEEVRRQRHH